MSTGYWNFQNLGCPLEATLGKCADFKTLCFWLVLKYIHFCHTHSRAWKCPKAPRGWDTTVHNFGTMLFFALWSLNIFMCFWCLWRLFNKATTSCVWLYICWDHVFFFYDSGVASHICRGSQRAKKTYFKVWRNNEMKKTNIHFFFCNVNEAEMCTTINLATHEANFSVIRLRELDLCLVEWKVYLILQLWLPVHALEIHNIKWFCEEPTSHVSQLCTYSENRSFRNNCSWWMPQRYRPI